MHVYVYTYIISAMQTIPACLSIFLRAICVMQCVFVCIYLCMFVCMYVCIVCMHVCIHACIRVCVYHGSNPCLHMSWLWLVDPLKLQVFFAKEPCKRDYILQKKPIILRSLLIIATPYLYLCVCSFLPRPLAVCLTSYMCVCVCGVFGRRIYVHCVP